MRRIYQLLSGLALAATIVPSAMFLSGRIELAHVTQVMLVGTIVWFAVTPLWMERKTDG